MSERKDIIKLPEGNMSYTILDVANLFLKSATLTGILVRAITKVAQELILQGANEIFVTIKDTMNMIVEIFYRGSVQRRHMKIGLTIQLYDEEITRVENLPPSRYKDLWLATLEEDMHRQLAKLRQN